MPKNHMPVAHFGVRPDDVRADVARPEDFARWRPEISVKAFSDQSNAVVIDILGLIGETWDDTGVTDQKVASLLRSAGDRDVFVNINSPGGDLFDGVSIYNMLRLHKGDVTVRVVGIAASAASIIAMAGDRIEIARSAFLMIHNAWTIGGGDQHGFRGIADQLAVFDETLADLYSVRSSIPAAEIGLMMNKDTYFSGRAAIEKGFADALLPMDQIETSPKAMAQASSVKAKAEFRFMARKAGYSRSSAIELQNRITGTPRAADDDTPRAVDAMAAFNEAVKSTLAQMESPNGL